MRKFVCVTQENNTMAKEDWKIEYAFQDSITSYMRPSIFFNEDDKHGIDDYDEIEYYWSESEECFHYMYVRSVPRPERKKDFSVLIQHYIAENYGDEEIWKQAILCEEEIWTKISNCNCFYIDLVRLVQKQIEIAINEKFIDWNLRTDQYWWRWRKKDSINDTFFDVHIYTEMLQQSYFTNAYIKERLCVLFLNNPSKKIEILLQYRDYIVEHLECYFKSSYFGGILMRKILQNRIQRVVEFYLGTNSRSESNIPKSWYKKTFNIKNKWWPTQFC